ncbi:MAG: hypothetical protein K0S35_3908, partial [Geminicoccaceae bacterium]|nr:hypothetical protein [Geminicoccaceae bacterium]
DRRAMVSLPDSGWVRVLLDQAPAGALVVAAGLFLLAFLGPVSNVHFVLLIIAAIFCLVPPANQAFAKFGEWRRDRRERRRRPEVLAHLDGLGPYELAILAVCLRNNEPSFNCFLGDSTATSLRQKGLAAKLPGWDGEVRRYPHVIPDYVWEELRRRSQEILSADDARQRAEAERAAAKRNRDGWLRRPYG